MTWGGAIRGPRCTVYDALYWFYINYVIFMVHECNVRPFFMVEDICRLVLLELVSFNASSLRSHPIIALKSIIKFFVIQWAGLSQLKIHCFAYDMSDFRR